MSTTPTSSGYLYVLYHHTFQQYGPDVYKLGMTINPKQRLQGYTTSFADECEYKYISDKFHNCSKAEKVLFYVLRSERLNKKREFFQLPLDRCIQIIQYLSSMKPDMLDKLYTQVCFEVVPLRVQAALMNDTTKIEAELMKWSNNDWTNNLPFDEYLEQFRWRPSKPEMWPTYVVPEVQSLHDLSMKLDHRDDEV